MKSIIQNLGKFTPLTCGASLWVCIIQKKRIARAQAMTKMILRKMVENVCSFHSDEFTVISLLFARICAQIIISQKLSVHNALRLRLAVLKASLFLTNISLFLCVFPSSIMCNMGMPTNTSVGRSIREWAELCVPEFVRILCELTSYNTQPFH